ncbi:hypothetical protein PRUPE_2G096800 [Prunus persica]|uniref:Uncharacterized protein n=1 Tax=Prunus persica TaxID=3760 RepID=A0A251QDH8_PRUPE|nr:hypothetical protein PRUPE_2G096800 [Prunus persica]
MMPWNFGISFRHKRASNLNFLMESEEKLYGGRWKMLKRSHICSYGMFNYVWLEVNGASSLVFEVIIVLALSHELYSSM